MSQFLIVQGERASEWFVKGLDRFEALCGLRPAKKREDPGLCTAVFPTYFGGRGGAPDFVERPDGEWICGAGAWLYGGSAGAAALERMLGHSLWLDDIEGMYVLARADASGLSVFTDRTGTLHAFEATIDSHVLISTSSLVLAALTKPDWDQDSLREFLSYGNVFENRTLWRGITKLEPAREYRFQDGRLTSQQKYWELRDHVWDQSSERGSVKAMAEALVESVRAIAAVNDAPVFDLTGGFDSRAVIGAARNAVSTVVVGLENDADVRVARLIAQTYRHPFQRLDPPRIWEQDLPRALALCDGEYDLLEYARIAQVQSTLAKTFSASVNGSNGEICKGYWWELLFPFTGSKGRFDARKVAAGRFAAYSGVASTLAHRFPTTLIEHYTQVIERACQGWEGLPNTALMDNVYLTLRMQRWQGRIASSTCRLCIPVPPPHGDRPVGTRGFAGPESLRATADGTPGPEARRDSPGAGVSGVAAPPRYRAPFLAPAGRDRRKCDGEATSKTRATPAG